MMLHIIWPCSSIHQRFVRIVGSNVDEMEAFLERTEKEIDPGRMKKVLNALPGFLRVSCFDAHEAEVYFAPSVGVSSSFVVCLLLWLCGLLANTVWPWQ